MNNFWSTYTQNPAFLDASRIQIMNRDMTAYYCEKLGIKENMKVLEVGCGTGLFTFMLAEKCKNVNFVGLDFDTNFIEFAKKHEEKDKNGNTFAFIEGDASNLPFLDNSFDLVISHTFLTAAFCYEKAILEMKRVAKKNALIGTVNIFDFGMLLNTTQSSYAKSEILYAQEKCVPRFSKNAGIDPKKVPEMFSDFGLANVSVYPIGSFFSLSNSAMDKETKIRYVNSSYEADVESLENLEKYPNFFRYVKHEIVDSYKNELKALKESLFEKIERDDKSFSDIIGTTYLLVTGKNIKTEDKISDNLAEYRKSKYKDDSPKETVKKIKGILNKLGIYTEEVLFSTGYGGLYSCRINIKGTEIGQNGKGTTPDFALASGYAEFMERLSTGFLVPFTARDKTEKGYPFKNIKTGEITYIDENTYRNCMFTNGSCAGNSKTEALTQGISEIMERYASGKVILGKMTPPQIPEEKLKSVPEIYKTICKIRENKDYYLRIFDASLGIGLPVIGAVLIDKKAKTECLRFGAHPRFETALERTITEHFQGVGLNMKPMTTPAGFEYEGIVDSERNRFNSLKVGLGNVSYKIFLDKPSWEYKERIEAPLTTKGQYEYLIGLCDKLGFDIYVRDCSFFGFNVYHTFCPQMGMLLDGGRVFFLQREMTEKYKDTFRNFPNASEKDQNSALNTIHLYKGFLIHEDLNFLSGYKLNANLFGLNINYAILSGLNKIKKGKYLEAAKMFAPYCRLNSKIHALHQLCIINSKEHNLDDAMPMLKCMFDEDEIESALKVFNNPFSVLPVCNYPNCDSCNRKDLCDTYYTNEIRKNLEEY